MSSRFIPRDELHNFVPWKMSELSPNGAKGSGLRVAPEGSEAAIQVAKEEGVRHGLSVGFKQGFEAGLAEATQQADRITAMIEAIHAKAGALDESIANELLSLSIEIARQVVRTTVATQSEAILPVIREALSEISSIARHPCIVLNPGDLELVRKELGNESGMPNCKFLADPAISSGGARIQDDTVEVDATIESRWRRAVSRVGRSDDWLK